MSTNINAGAVSVGDHSSAKNINKGVKAQEIASILDLVQNNLAESESEELTEKIVQLKKELAAGKIKPKKAEGSLANIIKKLNNSETIVAKIASIVGTTTGILALL